MGILDHRGYIISKADFTPAQLDAIRDELTVQPKVNTEYGPEATPYPVYKESKSRLYLPRFYGIEKIGPPTSSIFDVDDVVLPNLKTDMTLRDYQIDVITKTLVALKGGGGGGGAMLALYTGSGKTSIAIYLMCTLKVKTVILVHKSFLVEQWRERIKQFAPHAKIGVIQGAKVDVEGKDVVIGMIQSLSMKEYEGSVLNQFGMVIIDEVHHIGAEVFCRALPKVASKYMIGLSATPNRKDGLTKVIHWHVGPTAYKLDRTGAQTVLVKKIVFNSEDEEYTTVHKNFRGTMMLPKMINNIAAFTPRNQLILNEIETHIAEEHRQIMVISDRIAHLTALKTALDLAGLVIERGGKQRKLVTGFYTGKQKQRELVESEKADVIFSTYAMTREALDIQTLNTLIVATPTGDVVQTCGRILRKVHSISPLIIDVVDNFAPFIGQSKKRDIFYRNSEYAIATFDVTEESFDSGVLKKSAQELVKVAVVKKKGKTLTIDVSDEDEDDDEDPSPTPGAASKKGGKKSAGPMVFAFEDD
jgi:superfamily II DNA or RNA helicase